MPDDKLTIQQFAQKIKTKYPEYGDIDDSLLTQKIVDKYPEYKDMVHYEVSAPAAVAPTPQDHANEGMGTLRDYFSKHGDKAIYNLVEGKRMQDYRTQAARAQENGEPSPQLDVRLPNEVEPDIQNYKSQIEQNPAMVRPVVAQIKKDNPKEKAKINAAMYKVDASERTGSAQVQENLKKLESGEYDYDIRSGRITKPVGLFEGVSTGLKQRHDDLKDYDVITDEKKSPEEKIAILEQKRKDFNPDNPIPVSGGLGGTLGSLVGANAIPAVKGALGGAVAAVTGNPEAAPWAAAAASSGEFYKRGYINSLQESYNKYRDQGLEEKDAWGKAENEATMSGLLDVGQNVALTGLGIKAGLRGSYTKLSGSYANVLKGIAQNTKGFLLHATPEAGAQATIAAGTQGIKNLIQGKPVGEGTVEGAATQALLHYSIAGATSAGKGFLHEKAYQKNLDGLSRLPEQEVNKNIGLMVDDGTLTEDQAHEVTQNIAEQKTLNKGVPEGVSHENKGKIQELKTKRDDLEWQISKDNPDMLDKALHPAIKEKIDGVKKENADGTTEGRDGLNEQIRKLSESEKEEPFETFKEKEAPEVKVEKLSDIQQDMYKKDPNEFYKYLAEQTHSAGRENVEQMDGVSKAMVDYAVEKYPEHHIFEPKEEKPHVTVSTPNITNVKLKENASTIRSDQEQIPVGGEIPQERENVSGENIQQPAEQEAINGTAEQQAGLGEQESQTPGEKINDLPFGEEERSGIKNAISNAERFDRGLQPVDVPKLGNDSQILSEGKSLVDSGKIIPHEVVNDILKTNRGMQPDEAKAMQYYMHQLKFNEDATRASIADAADPIHKAELSGQLQQLDDRMEAATRANIIGGKAWSDVGNIRQIVVDKSYNASREKAIIKDAYGGELPSVVKERLDKITKERDLAIEQRNKAEERLKQVAADKAVEKIAKKAERSIKLKESKEQLLSEEKMLLDELKKAIKKDLGNLHAGIPLPKETLEIVGKLAVNYFKQGAITAEKLVTKLYDNLKEDVEGITKKDIRDFIAQYEPIEVLSETEKLNQKALRIGDKSTPTILKTKGGKLEGVSEKPDFNLKPQKHISFRGDPEWVKANQRVSNAEAKFRTLKREAFESKKNFYQKGLMWLGRSVRLSILSGYNVLAKLAAASTIGGAIKRIPEQTIGRIYGEVFKGISEKAPIEGSPNMSAELKFYKEFFNPVKFTQNAWEILKTGSSPLSKRLGQQEYEHIPVMYLPTDLHQIIKDPLKRGTFEASFKNGLSWAAKQGMDINDPLIIQSVENAAYKRANYEIFQEQNWLSKKFNDFKTKMERSGNAGATGKFIADFLVPVSTVPTNIAKRLASTSPLGLIRGGAKVVQAYRKGIENLKPEEADAIMRQLKQGSFGTAMWLVGWFGYKNFGGLYSKFDPNKKRQAGEYASDEMQVGGDMIPKPVQHALPLEIIQLAATARRIHDNYSEKKKEGEFSAIYNAGLGAIGATLEQIPVIETGVHLAEAGSDPYMAGKLKEDMKRRFEPQILRETGVIPKDEKNKNTSGFK